MSPGDQKKLKNHTGLILIFKEFAAEVHFQILFKAVKSFSLDSAWRQAISNVHNPQSEKSETAIKLCLGKV